MIGINISDELDFVTYLTVYHLQCLQLQWRGPQSWQNLVTSKITRDFCIVKVAPLGSLHDAASAISKKVSYHKGIGIRNFGESHLRYQKNGAIRVVG